MADLFVKLLTPHAKLPTYGSPFSAGLDLYSAQDIIIEPHSSNLVSTGIAIAVDKIDPNECYFRVAPRSGISSKYSLNVGAGVVDSDYRGEIKVLIFNHGINSFVINIGDRIAQLIPERRFPVHVIAKTELPLTERNQGGFGSTGK